MIARTTSGEEMFAGPRPRLVRAAVVSAVAAGLVTAGTAGGARAATASRPAAALRAVAVPHAAGWQQTPLPEPAGNMIGVAGTGAANRTWATGFSLPADGGPDFKPMAARWNGTAWVDTPVPVAPSAPDDEVMTRLDSAPAVLSATDVWAVGDSSIYTPSGDSVSQALVEHWNGTAWTQTPTTGLPHDSALYSVTAVAANNIWAGGIVKGEPGVMHYDGRTWKAVSTTAFDGLNPVSWVSGISSSGPDNVWAVGPVGLAAHYDGHTWKATPLPDLGGDEAWLQNVRTSATYGTWAVGYRVGDDHVRHPLTLHWVKGAWQLVTTPEPGDTQLQDVAFTTTGPDAFGYVDSATSEAGYGLKLPIGASGTAAVITTPSGTTGINGATAQPGGKGVWVVGTGTTDSPSTFPPFAARTTS